MLIGVPGSGKSTWIKNQNFDPDSTTILSTDDYIELAARGQGKTYTQAFADLIGPATSNMERSLARAVENDQDIVWDQTNTMRGARRKKLAKIPAHYEKVAVFFKTPAAGELSGRLGGRPGKDIPPDVMKRMIDSLEPPTKDEGFDRIVTIEN